MQKILAMFLLAAATATMASAQFGGRKDDVVLYLFSTKGQGSISVAPSTTVNTATGFETKDPFQQTAEQFGPNFPGESRRLLHKEDKDNFMVIVQKEWVQSEHQLFQDVAKVLIIGGMLRLLPPNKAPIDAPAGFYATFPSGVDFGPDIPVFEELSFLWTPFPNFPVITRLPPGQSGPAVPPGKTGIDVVVEQGQFLALKQWFSLYDLQPDAGWKEGIDIKSVDSDPTLGITVRLMRLRGGRTTPPFRINANTHVGVLQGRVNIAPVNGPATTLTQFQYAFVPNNFTITLDNPKVYDGPTAP